MNWNLLMYLIFFLVMAVFSMVYLTQIPAEKLRGFGNFIKKVNDSLPLAKICEAIKSIFGSSNSNEV